MVSISQDERKGIIMNMQC